MNKSDLILGCNTGESGEAISVVRHCDGFLVLIQIYRYPREPALCPIMPVHVGPYAYDISAQYYQPVCCVVTVCHQVGCMCWVHLGLFHRAITHSNWYQMVCMWDLACKFCQIKSTNMFPCICNQGFPGILFEELLWFHHGTSLLSCFCVYQRWSQTLTVT